MPYTVAGTEGRKQSTATIVVAEADQINGSLVEFVTRQFILNYADPLNVKDILVSVHGGTGLDLAAEQRDRNVDGGDVD